MLWSKSFIFTSKETPQEAEVRSHQLMLRACLIKKISTGVYAYLPLGLRVLRKVKEIIREEMHRAGAQELLLSTLQPFSIWKRSGRDTVLGKVMISFINRHGKRMVLGPTHEEIITELVAQRVKSYKDLPLILYQIQSKFRDEIRPRYGVIRGCEFTMKDAYSFDRDEDGLQENYQRMIEVYTRIFSRCGLSHCQMREADSEMMGGKSSHEFVLSLASGEEIELGHIFKLGTKYSEIFGGVYLDREGKQKPIVMGCYGIGVDRIIAACIEKHSDEHGIIWPISLSPFKVLIIPLGGSKQIEDYAFSVYQRLEKENIEVLLDDRQESAGVKFNDADLIGIPLRIIIGERNFAQGKVEINLRKGGKVQVDKERLVGKVQEMVNGEV
ncbi:MAG: proline--tRNA ligase [Candidatus Omnitrophota bacterium]|nr:MAG: proline--tRNA ligase [Candidatus Omnitrophota bacterium]